MKNTHSTPAGSLPGALSRHQPKASRVTLLSPLPVTLRTSDGCRVDLHGGMGPSTHAAVLCEKTGALLALTGPSHDSESVAYADLYAAASALLSAAKAARDVVQWAMEGGLCVAGAPLRDLNNAIASAEGADNPANYVSMGEAA